MEETTTERVTRLKKEVQDWDFQEFKFFSIEKSDINWLLQNLEVFLKKYEDGNPYSIALEDTFSWLKKELLPGYLSGIWNKIDFIKEMRNSSTLYKFVNDNYGQIIGVIYNESTKIGLKFAKDLADRFSETSEIDLDKILAKSSFPD